MATGCTTVHTNEFEVELAILYEQKSKHVTVCNCEVIKENKTRRNKTPLTLTNKTYTDKTYTDKTTGFI